jgi:hypothetical protein
MKQQSMLQLRLSEVRDEFDLIASDSLVTALFPILLSALSENEMK